MPKMKPDDTKDVEITITVTQRNRKLNISAAVPDHAEGTVAMMITQIMIGVANEKMNEALGVDEPIQTSKAH